MRPGLKIDDCATNLYLKNLRNAQLLTLFIQGDLRAAIPVKVGASHGSGGWAIVLSVVSCLQPRSQTISSSKASIEIQPHPIAQVASSFVITHSLFNSLFYFWAIGQHHKLNAHIKSHEYKLKLVKVLFNKPSF